MSKLKVYTIVIGVLFVAMAGLMVYLNYFAIITPNDTKPIPSNQINEVYVGKPKTLLEYEQIVASPINSFEECVAATNLVFTSYPSKCIAPNGRVFVNPGIEHGKVIKRAEQVK